MPWAAPHGRFTLLFECFAIEVLLAFQSVSAACELMGLNWGSAQRIIDRAVERDWRGGVWKASSGWGWMRRVSGG